VFATFMVTTVEVNQQDNCYFFVSNFLFERQLRRHPCWLRAEWLDS
jgi:hypothetical protein